MKRKIFYISCFTFIILIFKHYNIVLNSAIYGTNLWLNKVFPYLFIMIIINDLLLTTGFSNYFKNPAIYIFIMSLISGSPTSAYIIKSLYEKGDIDETYANISLTFSYFSNPLFLYTILMSIFNSLFITIKLILIHYLSNLIIYLIYKSKLKSNSINKTSINLNISNSIKKAMTTTIMVLGTIIFYLIITNVTLEVIPLSNVIEALFKGILELTQGLNSLTITNVPYKEIFATFFISFGGLSIHTQIKCILDEANLKYTYFLKGRIIQTMLSIFFAICSYAF